MLDIKMFSHLNYVEEEEVGKTVFLFYFNFFRRDKTVLRVHKICLILLVGLSFVWEQIFAANFKNL